MSSADLATLAAARLDVILDLAGIDDDRTAGAATYGVWTVEHTDEAGARAEAWLFAAMRERGIFRTSIVAERERRVVLYESFGGSDLPTILSLQRSLVPAREDRDDKPVPANDAAP